MPLVEAGQESGVGRWHTIRLTTLSFYEYLVRGGFPQTAQVDSITQAQRLLREDIIDKALKRDMTALFGVRRVLDLEHTFLYLCMHDGGLLDMGVATETAVFKHLFARYYAQYVRFTYWRGKKDHEVDLVAEVGGQIIPFEVKYRTQHTGARALKGLVELCERKDITRGYVVTKALDDFGLASGLPSGDQAASRIMRIPAPLLCYWTGAAESGGTDVED